MARLGAAAVLGTCIAVSGCARSGLDATAAAAEKLSAAATAYVAVPEDGRFGTEDYAGSGRAVAALVAAALSQRFGRVEVAPEPQAAREDLAQARAGGFTYLIRPTILRWEDHDTDWLGGDDRARVLLEAIHVASGDAADVAVVEARAGALAPAGEGATPAEALEAPLRRYASRLIPAAPATAAKAVASVPSPY